MAATGERERAGLASQALHCASTRLCGRSHGQLLQAIASVAGHVQRQPFRSAAKPRQ